MAKPVLKSPASVSAAPPPDPRIPAPNEAIAIVRDGERKWLVLHLKLVEELVCETRVIERTIHLDLAQDAARRAVLRLRS